MNKINRFVGLVLVLALVLSTCAFCLVGCNSVEDTVEDPIGGVQSGLKIEVDDNREIGLSLTPIDPEEYEAYGVSMAAESAYTLTAIVLPDYAYNKKVDWSLSFSGSSWSSGKSVTDYCTLSPNGDGALTATLSFLKPFGSQIIITVTSRDNPEAIGECYVDCARRMIGFSSLSISGYCLNNGKFYNVLEFNRLAGVTYSPDYSDYTVTDKIDVTDYEMCINNVCRDALIANGFECKNANEFFTINSNNNFFGNFVLNGLTGQSAMLVAQGGFDHVRSNFLAAMRSIGVGQEVGSIRITCTGTYSTYVQVFPIILDETCTITPVSEVHLNETGITI